MQAMARSKHDGFYIHKLRLDVQDGGSVDIAPVAPSTDTHRTAWIAAKLIGAALAAASALALVARELMP
jgi:hypothetical protein